MSTDTSNKTPKVSIGLPVFNGERFIRKSLDSLLGQTFDNFEIIISDNASSDLTPKICQEYIQKDNRIRYIPHKKNRGAIWNFNYVLNQARCDYFMWAAADDYWAPEFIEKNVKALDEEKSLVGSMSKIKLYDFKERKNSVDVKFKNFRIRIIEILRPGMDVSLKGSYNRKVRLLLKKSGYRVIYSIFKTDVLRKSMLKENFVGPDVAIVLNILKHGDINLINQVLMYRYKGGESTQGSIGLAKSFNQNKLGIVFPHYPLTKWFIRNLGWKIFLKNIDHFIKLNVASEFLVLMDMINSVQKKIKSSK